MFYIEVKRSCSLKITIKIYSIYYFDFSDNRNDIYDANAFCNVVYREFCKFPVKFSMRASPFLIYSQMKTCSVRDIFEILCPR